MNLADYHTHTPLCMHAEGSPEEYVQQALSAGLAEYGVADHAPVGYEFFDDWRMLYSQLPEYWNWVQRAQDAAKGQIPIKVGLECDWLPQCESWIEKLRAEYSWDYLIGSVHYLADQWDFDNPKWLGKWSSVNVEDVWQQYWDTYTDMISSGLFDIHGHPELIKKFGYVPKRDLRSYYDPAIEALVATNGAIELNTAGWYKPCAEQYPAVGFLERCAEAQVAIVVSSDAHAPSEVARDFDKATSLLRKVGFTTTVRFDQGQRYEISL